MTKVALRKIVLLAGVMVALIVVILFNAALLSANAAQVEQPNYPVHELMDFAVPNVIIHLF